MEQKEDTGKSMKNVLYVLQYVKRHFSGWTEVEQWKNQFHTIELASLKVSGSYSG